jgi:hypothetical protein
MDALETTTQTTPPVATPEVTPPTPAASEPPVSTDSEGNVVSILKNMNWIEVGFGVLGAAALYYAIYYYRYNINTQKSFQSEMQNKIDELNIKIADVNSVITNQEPASTTGNPFVSFVQ